MGTRFVCAYVIINTCVLWQPADGRTVTLGVLVPHSGPKSMGYEAEVAVTMAVDQANNDDSLTNLRAEDIQFDYLIANTECDIGTGLYNLVELSTKVDAFIGPACDAICEPAGLLAGKWNKPMISYNCASVLLADRSAYPTFVRTSTVYENLEPFLVDIMEHFHWDRVMIIEGAELIWRETAGHIQEDFDRHGLTADILSIPTQDPHNTLQKHLVHASEEAMVFIICAYAQDIMYVMCAAETGNLLTGEYAFISIDFTYMLKDPPTGRPCKMLHDLDGLVDLTIEVDDLDPDYQDFVRHLSQVTQLNHGAEMGIHAGMLYDAVAVYVAGLDAAIGLGYNESDGHAITHQYTDATFKGITGQVHIDSNGTRKCNFSMHNIHNGIYGFVAKHTKHSDGATSTTFYSHITWPGNTLITPLGRPVCGWNSEFCDEVNDYVAVVAATSVVFSLIILALIGFMIYYYRKKKRADFLESMAWKISYVELSFRTITGKRIGASSKNLSQIRSLKHRNINPLIGACIDPMKTSLLSVYCSRGSLQDVLENDEIKLDHIFKVSFATDIAKGMAYIHNSDIQKHGRLKSSNVLIDLHWTCRVGDIAMPVFREGERLVDLIGANKTGYQLLWTAPELLRDPGSSCTPAADAYSYAILLQEIIQRCGPYGYMILEPEDVLLRLKKKTTPPFRPEVVLEDDTICTLDDLMRICWEEVPMFRPKFASILDTLKKSNKGKTISLVDQMVHMMAKYADHLEELVQERTEQLDAEQKRTEELLCRMLPRSIANDLKQGKAVVPETFDSVTIFFSDIVGFTALASSSSPIEVVNFLNDLYTCFDKILETYDVYKVETIGDAYMVVSGMPVRNYGKHAAEIAVMALDLLSSVITFKIRHRPERKLQLRIGIHTGPVAVGVVGVRMPRYCLFGDTVNYASRMESTGTALRIQVSPECKEKLDQLDGFFFECRGEVKLKGPYTANGGVHGKGIVTTYFLLGRQGFSKRLPDMQRPASVQEHEFK